MILWRVINWKWVEVDVVWKINDVVDQLMMQTKEKKENNVMWLRDNEKSTFVLFSGVTCRKHEIQKAVGKKAYSEATRKLQQERKQQESWLTEGMCHTGCPKAFG